MSDCTVVWANGVTDHFPSGTTLQNIMDNSSTKVYLKEIIDSNIVLCHRKPNFTLEDGKSYMAEESINEEAKLVNLQKEIKELTNKIKKIDTTSSKIELPDEIDVEIIKKQIETYEKLMDRLEKKRLSSHKLMSHAKTLAPAKKRGRARTGSATGNQKKLEKAKSSVQNAIKPQGGDLLRTPTITLTADVQIQVPQGKMQRLNTTTSITTKQQEKPSNNKSSISTRVNIVEELVKGEETYLDNLNILGTIFEKNLKQTAENNFPDLLQPIKEIFSNLHSITQTSRELLEKLNAEIQEHPDDPLIGKVFIDISAYNFRFYTSYVSGYDERIKKLKILKQNESFNNYLNELEANNQDQLKKRTLNDILIHPVKRLPQYQILLERLVKHTTPDHADYISLVASEKNCKQVTQHFEDQSQNAASAMESIRIINSIKISKKFSSLKVSTPHRCFRFDDHVKANISPLNNRITSYIVCAFSDCVLFSVKKFVQEITGIGSNFERGTLKFYFNISSLIDCNLVNEILEITFRHDGEEAKIILHGTTDKSFQHWQSYLFEEKERAKELISRRKSAFDTDTQLIPKGKGLRRTTSQKMEKISF